MSLSGDRNTSVTDASGSGLMVDERRTRIVESALMDPRKYIVMASPLLGGAEKRFFDIYCALVETDPLLHFVVPAPLADALGAPDASPAARRNLIPLDVREWSVRRFLETLYAVIRTAPRHSVFHYPLNPVFPLHMFRGHRLSMSICDCTRAPARYHATPRALLQHWAMRRARAIDVLSPSVYATLAKRAPRRIRSRLSATPLGTFVNSTEHTPLEKRRDVVLMTRLEEGKGVRAFLDRLPRLWDYLAAAGMPGDTRFLICGDGTLASTVTSEVARLRRSGIRVEAQGTVDARTTLGRARVALSLQRDTNFPSRVVGEALLCGCAVLIRNTGDSGTFGAMAGISYLEPELPIEEVGDRLVEVLRLPDEDYDAFAMQIRTEALLRCSSDESLQYFKALLSADA